MNHQHSQSSDSLLPGLFWWELGERNIHPWDEPHLDASRIVSDRLPQPWMGSLESADIFVCFGNPGSAGPEAAYEGSSLDFRRAMIGNLRGKSPHLFLGAAFATHPGYAWMRSTFGDLASPEMASRICTLEIFPYATTDNQNGYGKAVAPRLPSSAILAA